MKPDDDFTATFHELYPRLCGFLERLLRDPERAREIAQESLLRLFRFGVERLNPDERRFWTFRVARNLALNDLDRTKTRWKLFEAVTGWFNRPSADPEKTVIEDERRQTLDRWLDALPEHQRAALVLREREEMSYREIAEVLDVSESKVKADIFRARTALRTKLTEWNAPRVQKRK